MPGAKQVFRNFCLISIFAFLVMQFGCGSTHDPFAGENNSVANHQKTLLAAKSPLKASESDVKAVVAGNTAFAIDLYAKIASGKGNLIFSPFSISMALSMTYIGAKGKTAKEMANVMHLPLDQDKLHPGLAALQERYRKLGSISVANRLWLQDGYPLLDDFLWTNAAYYGSGVGTVNFKEDPEASRKLINDWVALKTRKRIKELIKPKVIKTITRLVLTNAIYFKDTWKKQFEKDDTRPTSFYLSSGSDIKVPMMHSKGTYRYTENADIQALELPYKGNEVGMLILLPQKNNGLKELESKLSLKLLQTCISNLRNEDDVDIFLPRFKATLPLSLNETLKAMGMPVAFTDNADFSGMETSGELKIGAVVHKAFIEVNEEGTEAAAATAVVMDVKSLPKPSPVFRADHPFVFLLRDLKTGTILFMGRVEDPRE